MKTPETIDTLPIDTFPLLREIPEPPKQLYYRGTLPDPSVRMLAVVGSRKYTNYGKQCVQELIRGLRGYPVSIVSGLALGIDGLAHTAALDAGLHTIAVPGSGLSDSVLYPRTNRGLGRKILEAGGGMLSEFEPTMKAAPWSFPQRNRIIAGMTHATLVIEAGERSGTLITTRLAVDYNRDVLVVPGSIFSANSRGAHQFMKLGATPVTSSEDILEALGIDTDAPKQQRESAYKEGTPEATVLGTLTEPSSRDAVIRSLTQEHGIDTGTAGMLLMQMELAGDITASGDMLSRSI